MEVSLLTEEFKAGLWDRVFIPSIVAGHDVEKMVIKTARC